MAKKKLPRIVFEQFADDTWAWTLHLHSNVSCYTRQFYTSKAAAKNAFEAFTERVRGLGFHEVEIADRR